MAFPFVSVITPTYNRRCFIPAAIECYKHQTYPKERMEWIILDDGTESVEDLFTEAATQKGFYKHHLIGKRHCVGEIYFSVA